MTARCCQMQTNKHMDYSFYLFCQLHDEIRGTKNSKLPYDTKFNMLVAEYDKFKRSIYDNKVESEYDNISRYMTCRDYLGLAGITSHNPQVVFKYNRLLNELGAEGMLIQIERYFDSEDISDLIQHIEDNLGENGIDLPYYECIYYNI